MIDYTWVSEAAILRDWIELNIYVNNEHELLTDIADSLYNVGSSMVDRFTNEYKTLYNKYGKEYFDRVLDDMSALDSQVTSDSKAQELIDDYLQRVSELDPDNVGLYDSFYDNDDNYYTGEFESYKRESVTDEYIEITMYDGDVRRYNRDTDLEKFQYDWSEDIRDLVGDDVSSGEIDDIARELFYYEIPNTDDELTDDDIYEMIRQMLESDSPNADNDAWKLYVDGCKPKKKSKKKQMLTQRKGCVDSCGSRRKSEALHGDLVYQIYSVMMNYEYGYDPDMSDINAMLQDLVINNGIDNIKSNAFKKAWISAHNKAERKTWGNSGDAMKYDSLTSTEQDAIDNFDEDYWKRWRK